MGKKLAFLVIITSLIAGVFLVLKSKNYSDGQDGTNGSNENPVILFVSATCPHCKIVEDWLNDNPIIKEKSGLNIKDIYNNQDNKKQLIEKTGECKINENEGISVPSLYDHGECIIGDQPIINYLQEKYK